MLYNTSIPDSTLNNKYQSITYHLVSTGVSRYELSKAYVSTHKNKSFFYKVPIIEGEEKEVYLEYPPACIWPLGGVIG